VSEPEGRDGATPSPRAARAFRILAIVVGAMAVVAFLYILWVIGVTLALMGGG